MSTTAKLPKMKTHWVADMYPLNEADIEPLAESIKANGQRTPIMALKDGTIIDGRNRWLACQRAGVEPIVTIINQDGKEVSETELWAIATDCNSMRRDMTSSLRACLAAESWKRLREAGKVATNKGGRGNKTESKNGQGLDDGDDGSFAAFAKVKFKIAGGLAKQAQAILNYSPELLEDAKNDLAGTYKTYQSRVAEDRTKRQNMQFLEAPENSDIKERVGNGGLTDSEAITLVRARHADELKRIQIEEETRKVNRRNMGNLAAFHHLYAKTAPAEIADIIKARKGEEPISDTGGQALDRDMVAALIAVLTSVHAEL